MSEQLFLCHNFFKCFLALLGTTGASYRVTFWLDILIPPLLTKRSVFGILIRAPVPEEQGVKVNLFCQKLKKSNFSISYMFFYPIWKFFVSNVGYSAMPNAMLHIRKLSDLIFYTFCCSLQKTLWMGRRHKKMSRGPFNLRSCVWHTQKPYVRPKNYQNLI